MMRIGAVVMGLGLVLGLGASGARADCDLEPSGSRPNGAIIKNTDHNVLQYCDGTTWRLLSLSAVATEQISVLTTGTTWTVPADWNSANNTIHIFGAGGGGERDAGGAGGGGEYRKLINFSATPGSNISYTIGTGGIGGISGTSDATDGGNTTFNSNAVIAIGGKRAFNYGDGGAGGAGGTGGAGSTPGGRGGNNDFGKGGDAGGPNGIGANGGIGPGVATPPAGTNGTEIGGLYGAGGGGIGGWTVGGAGGSFGGGGGGGTANGGAGGPGGIVIVYTPAGVGSGGTPDCTNDATATCTLDADRDSDDPQMVAANIANGVNILGVTGSLVGGAPDCTNDATATCTLDADRDSGDPQLVAANIANGVNILGVTGSLVAPAVPTAADGYLVLTSNFWNGNLGGFSGANAKCLSALTATAWKNKAVASGNGQLVAGKVRAFLCDGTTCQNGQPNTKYFFATALDATGGGDSFTTNGSGQGPNNSDLWGQATRLTGGDEIPSYWSGRAQTGTTLWPTTSHASRCNAWASSAGGQSGMTGRANTSDGGNTRWAVATGTCDDDFHLLCFVDP